MILTKIFSHLIYIIMRILHLTYRYQFIGLENKILAKSHHPNGAYVYALWHQNLIGAIFSHILTKEKFTMPISESKDGELVAITCQKLGHIPARGSSTRGGQKALLDLVRKIKSGAPGALTVDGPKGPAHEVKPGVIEVAKLCECAILPLSPYPSAYWSFKKSWDQFRVPKPFAKIVVAIGAPIFIPKDIKKDQFESFLLQIKNEIDAGEAFAQKNAKGL